MSAAMSESIGISISISISISFNQYPQQSTECTSTALATDHLHLLTSTTTFTSSPQMPQLSPKSITTCTITQSPDAAKALCTTSTMRCGDAGHFDAMRHNVRKLLQYVNVRRGRARIH